MKKVRKAVFPVAGLGTRFLPATKAVPKEMLPVVDKPLIQYAVDEALAAGIELMIFITGRGKTAIEDYFDLAYELEANLGAKRKHDIMESLQIVDYIYFVSEGGIVAEGTPDELRASQDPWVYQFIHAEADGPVPFHYPAEPLEQSLIGGRGA